MVELIISGPSLWNLRSKKLSVVVDKNLLSFLSVTLNFSEVSFGTACINDACFFIQNRFILSERATEGDTGIFSKYK